MSPVSRAWVIALACVPLVAVAACTRVETKPAPPGVSLSDAGAGGDGSSSGGSSAGAGAEPEGGAPQGIGGAALGLELGVWPTFAPESEESLSGQAVLAAVAALSAGSAVLPLVERWDTLSGATGSPLKAAWAKLDNQVRPYRDAQRKVALCVAVADRALDARPFDGSLDSPAARSAIERTIDEAFSHFAADLSQLCFGYEVDRFLATLSAAEGEQLLAFLTHSVRYASGHRLRSSTTTIGVALTLEALTTGEPSGSDDFSVLGDAAFAVYDPLAADGELRSPESIAADLPAALARIKLTSSDAARSLALFEVGYPSATGVGASEKAQRAFYENLFESLGESGGQVPFVGLFGFGDRAASECELEAPAFGVQVDADPAVERARAVTRCSMGLWAEATRPKLAWPAVVSALSRYR